MTRSEAISLIKSAQLMLINPTTNEPVSDLYMALYMAISALEQEPSRKGHWITKIDDTAHNFPFGKRVECSECGQRFVTGDSVSRKYCPNCGAKMIEPQENEEISERNMKMWEEIFKAERGDKE